MGGFRRPRQLVSLVLPFVPLLGVTIGCPASSSPVAARSPDAARSSAVAPRETVPAAIETAERETPSARERRWSTPFDLDPREGEAMFPQLAMDANGNAIVAWYQDGEGRSTVHVRRFDSARTRWESLQTFGAPERDGHETQVAMTRGGAAVLVWTELDGGKSSLHAARYAPTRGWGDRAELVPSQTASVYSPSVAIAERGDIVAVWEAESGAQSSVHSNRFDAASGAWSGPEPREQNRFSNHFPSVAVDDLGNAIVAWTHHRKSGVVIHIARFDAAAGSWQTMPPVSDRRWRISAPAVTMGPRGAVWITWHSRRPSNTPVFVNTWERVFVDAWNPGAARWERAMKLGSDSHGVREGKLLRDDAALVLVWARAVDQQHHLFWRALDADSGTWSEPAAIDDTESTGSNYNIDLASDGAGNVMIVWQRHAEGRSDLFVSRLDHDAGRWSTPTMLDTEGAAQAEWAAIAAAVDGTAIVVWTEAGDHRRTLHARRFE